MLWTAHLLHCSVSTLSVHCQYTVSTLSVNCHVTTVLKTAHPLHCIVSTLSVHCQYTVSKLSRHSAVFVPSQCVQNKEEIYDRSKDVYCNTDLISCQDVTIAAACQEITRSRWVARNILISYHLIFSRQTEPSDCPSCLRELNFSQNSTLSPCHAALRSDCRRRSHKRPFERWW